MNIAQTLPLADWWGMHGDVGTGWMILMMTLMVLFWGAVIFGIVWLIRGAARGWPAPGEKLVAPEHPLQVLDRRFAEGAISVEEYRERRKFLVNGSLEANEAANTEPLAAPRGEASQR